MKVKEKTARKAFRLVAKNFSGNKRRQNYVNLSKIGYRHTKRVLKNQLFTIFVPKQRWDIKGETRTFNRIRKHEKRLSVQMEYMWPAKIHRRHSAAEMKKLSFSFVIKLKKLFFQKLDVIQYYYSYIQRSMATLLKIIPLQSQNLLTSTINP